MTEYIFRCEYDTLNGTFSQKRGKEIVRCRDCLHYKTGDAGSYCCKSITTLHNPDGFCAWGERRDA